MWHKITNNMKKFTSAVLTGTDVNGYPFSIRCRPESNPARQTLRLTLPDASPIQPGPAGLLYHSHDELLWNLKSFLVRGRLEREENEWVFYPDKFIPGGGIGGPLDNLKSVFRMRATASNYLKKRALPRPQIPWGDFNALWAEARKNS